ncbi:MAG TPA: glycosyl hydrolase 53 family protein [Treponemataceae bacterium]|nr:glycosyl hydrolase 53 family protein [Treponemataceae bacterium]
MKHLRFYYSAFMLTLIACSHSPAQPPLPANPYGTFAKGADISWLPQMEATGYIFRDDQGNVQDCLTILKDHGIESIRLRVWVNPSSNPQSGHNSPEEMVAMAKRVSEAGFRLMVDFHYSDSWADPGQQVKPAAWASHSFTQLKKDVYDHTYSVMKALEKEGIHPEWVQIGNEINPGMLLPDGSTSNYDKLTALLNSGFDAVKKVSPSSKVIIHLASGIDNAFCRHFFDRISSAGARFDVIGLSYYPYWLKSDYTTTITALAANLHDLASRYEKEVIIVEVGGLDTHAQNTKDTIIAVMDRVNAVPEARGIGIFYWEPQGTRSWSKYALSAWGKDSRPTIALDAFLSNPQSRASMNDPDGSIHTIFSNSRERYLSADSATGGNITASSATVASDAQRFAMFANNDGTISYKSLATGKYLSAPNTTNVLLANSPHIGPAQKFILIERADGFQAIRSSEINTTWDISEDRALRSQWDDASGGWQSFSVFKEN